MYFAEMQAAVMAMAAGADGIDLPSWQETRQEFDTWLLAEPARVEHRQQEIRRLVGVGA